MLEVLLLTSALSAGCIERDASSLEEFFLNRGRSIVECHEPELTQLSVLQSVTFSSTEDTSIAFQFEDESGLTTFRLSPCPGFDLGPEGYGEGLLPDVFCNGEVVVVALAPGALEVKSDGELLFSYPIPTQYVSVNSMIYDVGSLPSSD